MLLDDVKELLKICVVRTSFRKAFQTWELYMQRQIPWKSIPCWKWIMVLEDGGEIRVLHMPGTAEGVGGTHGKDNPCCSGAYILVGEAIN